MPRCQMSGQLYKIANQPVTPHAPLFFHACHPLMNTLHTSRHFSCLSHALSHASCIPSRLPHHLTCWAHDTQQCHVPVATKWLHRPSYQTISYQVAMLIICGHACVCEGECVDGNACLSTCPPSHTHAVCVISNWPCMCA